MCMCVCVCVCGWVAMASRLVCSSLDRSVPVRALAGNIVLCTSDLNSGGNPAMD